MQYSFSSLLATLTIVGVTVASPTPTSIPASTTSPATTSPPPVSEMDFGIIPGTASDDSNSCYLFAVWGSYHTRYGPIGDLTSSPSPTGFQTVLPTAPSVACNWDPSFTGFSAWGQSVSFDHEDDGTHVSWSDDETCILQEDWINVPCHT
ncbi:uncharacterized protein PFLUO_LOCUS5607 [Penicillium psychrofluorescens]|uniref:uncharacterized protein n=1 Tax=Penicillium psychrofluorescens TaxID=3158075 RepID=UPI003CCD8F8F